MKLFVSVKKKIMIDTIKISSQSRFNPEMLNWNTSSFVKENYCQKNFFISEKNMILNWNYSLLEHQMRGANTQEIEEDTKKRIIQDTPNGKITVFGSLAKYFSLPSTENFPATEQEKLFNFFVSHTKDKYPFLKKCDFSISRVDYAYQIKANSVESLAEDILKIISQINLPRFNHFLTFGRSVRHSNTRRTLRIYDKILEETKKKGNIIRIEYSTFKKQTIQRLLEKYNEENIFKLENVIFNKEIKLQQINLNAMIDKQNKQLHENFKTFDAYLKDYGWINIIESFDQTDFKKLILSFGHTLQYANQKLVTYREKAIKYGLSTKNKKYTEIDTEIKEENKF